MKHAKSSPETKQLLIAVEERISSRINAVMSSHEDREMGNYESLRKIFEDHVNETKELNNTFRDLITGGKVVSSIFSILVKTVAGLGVLMGAIYALKEWLKK